MKYLKLFEDYTDQLFCAHCSLPLHGEGFVSAGEEDMVC